MRIKMKIVFLISLFVAVSNARNLGIVTDGISTIVNEIFVRTLTFGQLYLQKVTGPLIELDVDNPGGYQDLLEDVGGLTEIIQLVSEGSIVELFLEDIFSSCNNEILINTLAEYNLQNTDLVELFLDIVNAIIDVYRVEPFKELIPFVIEKSSVFIQSFGIDDTVSLNALVELRNGVFTAVLEYSTILKGFGLCVVDNIKIIFASLIVFTTGLSDVFNLAGAFGIILKTLSKVVFEFLLLIKALAVDLDVLFSALPILFLDFGPEFLKILIVVWNYLGTINLSEIWYNIKQFVIEYNKLAFIFTQKTQLGKLFISFISFVQLFIEPLLEIVTPFIDSLSVELWTQINDFICLLDIGEVLAFLTTTVTLIINCIQENGKEILQNLYESFQNGLLGLIIAGLKTISQLILIIIARISGTVRYIVESIESILLSLDCCLGVLIEFMQIAKIDPKEFFAIAIYILENFQAYNGEFLGKLVGGLVVLRINAYSTLTELLTKILVIVNSIINDFLSISSNELLQAIYNSLQVYVDGGSRISIINIFVNVVSVVFSWILENFDIGKVVAVITNTFEFFVNVSFSEIFLNIVIFINEIIIDYLKVSPSELLLGLSDLFQSYIGDCERQSVVVLIGSVFALLLKWLSENVAIEKIIALVVEIFQKIFITGLSEIILNVVVFINTLITNRLITFPNEQLQAISLNLESYINDCEGTSIIFVIGSIIEILLNYFVANLENGEIVSVFVRLWENISNKSLSDIVLNIVVFINSAINLLLELFPNELLQNIGQTLQLYISNGENLSISAIIGSIFSLIFNWISANIGEVITIFSNILNIFSDIEISKVVLSVVIFVNNILADILTVYPIKLLQAISIVLQSYIDDCNESSIIVVVGTILGLLLNWFLENINIEVIFNLALNVWDFIINIDFSNFIKNVVVLINSTLTYILNIYPNELLQVYVDNIQSYISSCDETSIVVFVTSIFALFFNFILENVGILIEFIIGVWENLSSLSLSNLILNIIIFINTVIVEWLLKISPNQFLQEISEILLAYINDCDGRSLIVVLENILGLLLIWFFDLIDLGKIVEIFVSVWETISTINISVTILNIVVFINSIITNLLNVSSCGLFQAISDILTVYINDCESSSIVSVIKDIFEILFNWISENICEGEAIDIFLNILTQISEYTFSEVFLNIVVFINTVILDYLKISSSKLLQDIYEILDSYIKDCDTTSFLIVIGSILKLLINWVLDSIDLNKIGVVFLNIWNSIFNYSLTEVILNIIVIINTFITEFLEVSPNELLQAISVTLQSYISDCDATSIIRVIVSIFGLLINWIVKVVDFGKIVEFFLIFWEKYFNINISEIVLAVVVSINTFIQGLLNVSPNELLQTIFEILQSYIDGCDNTSIFVVLGSVLGILFNWVLENLNFGAIVEIVSIIFASIFNISLSDVIVTFVIIINAIIIEFLNISPAELLQTISEILQAYLTDCESSSILEVIKRIFGILFNFIIENFQIGKVIDFTFNIWLAISQLSFSELILNVVVFINAIILNILQVISNETLLGISEILQSFINDSKSVSVIIVIRKIIGVVIQSLLENTFIDKVLEVIFETKFEISLPEVVLYIVKLFNTIISDLLNVSPNELLKAIGDLLQSYISDCSTPVIILIESIFGIIFTYLLENINLSKVVEVTSEFLFNISASELVSKIVIFIKTIILDVYNVLPQEPLKTIIEIIESYISDCESVSIVTVVGNIFEILFVSDRSFLFALLIDIIDNIEELFPIIFRDFVLFIVSFIENGEVVLNGILTIINTAIDNTLDCCSANGVVNILDIFLQAVIEMVSYLSTLNGFIGKITKLLVTVFNYLIEIKVTVIAYIRELLCDTYAYLLPILAPITPKILEILNEILRVFVAAVINASVFNQYDLDCLSTATYTDIAQLLTYYKSVIIEIVIALLIGLVNLLPKLIIELLNLVSPQLAENVISIFATIISVIKTSGTSILETLISKIACLNSIDINSANILVDILTAIFNAISGYIYEPLLALVTFNFSVLVTITVKVVNTIVPLLLVQDSD